MIGPASSKMLISKAVFNMNFIFFVNIQGVNYPRGFKLILIPIIINISQMKKIVYLLFPAFLSLGGNTVLAQKPDEVQNPTLITRSDNMFEVPSIASRIASGTFIPAENRVKEFNPKHWGSNTSVPGKGLPKGNDPL